MDKLRTAIGPFRIVGTVGEGGMGVVYRAVHATEGHEVALKTVRVPDAWMLQSIRREIHGLARLRHPGIVRILDHGMDQGIPWYAMELVPGQSLNSLLEAGRPHDGTEPGTPVLGDDLRGVLTLVRRLCAPLAFLHGEGVVHQDLKPANILVRPDGMPVLMDFGLLARFSGSTHREVLAAGGPLGGSLAYMAPEQFRGELVDARTDLYALGCILYAMLSGAPPFPGRSLDEALRDHLLHQPPRLSDVVPGLPADLVELVARLLAKDPRQRVGHADDVAATLEKLGAEDGTGAPGPRPRPYLYRPALGGRSEQLAGLKRHVSLLGEGRGGLVLMGGESGVGKTRLALELGREAIMDGVLLMTGECLPTGGRPLEPLRGPLQAIADYCRQMGEGETTRVLGARGPVLAAYEPSLSTLPGQARFPEPPEVPAEAARFRLLSSLSEVVVAMVERKKTLLILDDLQWADELTIDWLSFLAQGTYLRSCPLLLLGTYRTGEASGRLNTLLGGAEVVSVALDRLDDDAVGAMVGDMLAIYPPNEELGRRLARLSEGNPFFVAEYLHAAVVEGILSRDAAGRWRITIENGALGLDEALNSLPTPGSLHELSDRRLARLSAGARRLAAAASAAGREVPESLFASLGPTSETEVMETASELLGAQVLEEGEEGTLRFVHDKLREAAYRSLSPDERRIVHSDVAAWYERTHSGDLSPFHPVLAHHWQEAGEVSRAVVHLGEAGGQALRRGAYEEALAHLKHALGLSEGLPGGEAQDELVRRARWERQAAEAALGLGRLAESRDRMQRAAASLGWPLPASPVALFGSLVREILVQVWHWIRSPARLDPATTEASRFLEGARVFRGLITLFYFRSEMLSTLHAGLRSLNLAQRLGASSELVEAYANVAFAAALAPAHALAEAYGRRAISTAREARTPAALAWALEVDGVWRAGAGDWERALVSLTEATSLCDSLRAPRHWIDATCAHSTILHYRGDWTTRVEMGRAVLDRARLSENVQGQAWGMLDQAESLLPLGRVDEALTLLEGARILLAVDIGRAEEIWTYGLLARARLLAGQPDLSLQAADEALVRMQSIPPTAFYTLDGYVGAAEAFLAAWESASEAPPAKRQRLRASARGACGALRTFAGVMPIGQPWALLYQGLFDWMDGRNGRARRGWRKAQEAASRLGMPLAEGLAHFQLGRHLEADSPLRRAHLEQAGAVFERIGALRHLAASRAALQG